jgi:hypothetical protein
VDGAKKSDFEVWFHTDGEPVLCRNASREGGARCECVAHDRHEMTKISSGHDLSLGVALDRIIAMGSRWGGDRARRDRDGQSFNSSLSRL